jgi:hypothetical protein
MQLLEFTTDMANAANDLVGSETAIVPGAH